MRIQTIRIENYKCFEDSGEQHLAANMNVVVGQNSVGKTSLLRAIAQRDFSLNAHKNQKQEPDWTLNQRSAVEVHFVASGKQTRSALIAHGWDTLVPINKDEPRGSANLEDEFFARDQINYFATFRSSSEGTAWVPWKYPSSNALTERGGGRLRLRFNKERNDFNKNVTARDTDDNVGVLMGHILSAQTYLFDAIRIPQSNCSYGDRTELLPNAQNLAEVLNNLQGQRTRYENYIEHVKRVLPLVKWINVEGMKGSSNQAEIRIWNVDERTQRYDLTVPLSATGTGVGQVLALLYVVLEKRGNIILVDEPNSFLHPGAARELMAILRENTQHQFIIATHSPEIVVAAQPDRLFLLGSQDGTTTVTHVDQKDIQSLRLVLEEVGSRFSDVFGIDRIGWVEGPTERECFPLLLSASGKKLSPGYCFAALRATGDLEGKRNEALPQMYENVSTAGSLLPVAFVVSLDGDKEHDHRLERTRAYFGHRLRFLPRRTYENFLINTKAIAALLLTLPAFSNGGIDEDTVRTWIEDHGNEAKYHAASSTAFSPEWHKNVDGARLLEDLFQAVSNAKEIYHKPLHSVILTQWILEEDRDSIDELITYVGNLLPQ